MLRYRNGWKLTLFLLICWWAGALAFGKDLVVNVTAESEVREVPVSVILPASEAPDARILKPGETVCQVETAGPRTVRITWTVHDLKPGETREVRLVPPQATDPVWGKPEVEVKKNGKNLDFLIQGKLFTRYDVTTGPNKPYFYPIIGPTGVTMVRHWPVEDVPGETHDHPHHRGLWFTHSSVNGADFWLEGKSAGKTVHTGYDAIESGPVYGLMRSRTDWIMPDGKKVAEDAREVRVYYLREGTVMDFTVTVKAVGGPVVWGDAKDGVLGMRLADSMRAAVEKGKVAEGHILNSNGIKDGATWGKTADWVDYYGPVDGQTVGVAIFDSPNSFRHPTYWHVRDYGLFAANPFGLHDFVPEFKDQADKGAYTLPKGQTMTFSYRLFFHKGTPQEAGIAGAWSAFSHPPKVEVQE
jgi:hypothetical protein